MMIVKEYKHGDEFSQMNIYFSASRKREKAEKFHCYLC